MEQPKLKNIQPQAPALPAPVYLDNGVEVNAIPFLSTDLVVVTLMFNGGQWVQQKKLQSDFAVRYINLGTAHFTAEALAERLDYYGATLHAGVTMPYGYVQLNCLRRTLPNVLPLLCEIITSPRYEQVLLDNALEEGMRAWQMAEQKVAQVCKRIFYRQLLGGDHPAAQHPTEADYLALQREDLLAYHRQFVHLSNAVMYVTGRVDSALIALLNQHIGSIDCGKRNLLVHPQASMVPSPQRMSETELAAPSVQSGLRMGRILPDSTSKDHPAMLLASTILGGYFGSRLMKNIRERLGLTYGIGSTFYALPYNDVFIVATETPREHVARCLEEIRKELVDMQENPISDEELNLARHFMLGQFCRTTETSLSLSTLLMSQRTFGRTLEDLLHEQENMQSLTPEDVQRCARQYFSPDDMFIVAVHGKTPQ